MAKTFRLNITTPKEEFFDEDVEFFDIKIARGYIGFLAKHSPLTSLVKPSEFIIRTGKQEIKGLISNGVVMMTGEKAIVVVTNIIKYSDINKEEAQKELDKIKQSLQNPSLLPYEKQTLEKEHIFYEKVINYV